MEQSEDPCFICNMADQRFIRLGKTPNDVYWKISCDCCGDYDVADQKTADKLGRLQDFHRPKFSGWIREKNRSQSIPIIDVEVFNERVVSEIPTSRNRALCYLAEALYEAGRVGVSFRYLQQRYVGATYSQNKNDLHELLRYLKDNAYLTNMTLGGVAARATVTVEGEEAILELDI